MTALRTVEERRADVLAMLERNGHMWLATAHEGMPHVIAVSAWWTGEDLVVATLASSRTAANLQPGGWARLAVGDQDDAVVILARAVEARPAAEAEELAGGFAGVMGWDPREMDQPWAMIRLRPARVQAFRGFDEIQGRDVMRKGAWLTSA